MAVTNEFERDLTNQAQLKRPGRVDMVVFQNIPDAGDGSPGIQRCFRNYLHEGGMEKDLDLIGYAIKGTSVNISNAEMQQLSNIGAATISGTQWGYVGNLDQNLRITDSPSFGGLSLTGNLVLAANSITGTSVDINNAELQQLTNIGAATISGTQWGYVGTLNQALASGNNVVFAQITMSGDIIMGGDNITFTSGLVDGVDVSAHVHTDADGSLKIAHVNTTGIGEDNHHAKTHNNNEHSTNYKADFSENSGFNRAFGTTINTVIHGNDGRLSNARAPTSHSHLTGDLTHTLDDAFDDGNIIDGATNANPFEVGGSTNYRLKFWRGSTSLYMSSGSSINDFIIQCEKTDGDIHLKPQSGGNVYLGYGDAWVAAWNGMLRPVGDNSYQLGNVGAAPSKGYFHLLYHNGITPSFSHVDDLQLLREIEEDQILKEKKDKDGKIVGTQRSWKKESLPWIKARDDLKDKTGDELNFATVQGEEVGYILSAMKKILERQDVLLNGNFARDVIIDSLISRLDIIENK